MEWWVWPTQPEQYSIYLFGSSSPFWSDFWAAAFGALIGAGAAFVLAWWEKQREERRRRVAAGNLALLTMYRMWYEIYNYEKHIIREALKKDSAIPLWLRVSLLARTPAELRFDFASIVFLLRSSEPQRLATTALQETRYHELFHAVMLRNTVLASVQESMAKEAIGVVTYPTDEELVRAIGIPDIAKLRTLTVGVFDSVYKNLLDMRAEYLGLIALLVKEFGKRDVVAFALEEKFPDELGTPVERWLGLLTLENNSRPATPPF